MTTSFRDKKKFATVHGKQLAQYHRSDGVRFALHSGDAPDEIGAALRDWHACL